MQSITKIILSILSFAFAIWIFVLAWRMWRGTWQPDETQAIILVAAFLLLSCTYILTTSIHNGAKLIAQKEVDQRKIMLYENILSTLQTIIETEEVSSIENIDEKLAFLKSQVGIHANIRVLQSYIDFYDLFYQKARTNQLKESYINLVLNMRSDLGKSNISIKEELVRMV